LLADVPLGVWLDGGIDSATILHYAASASDARLKTFSIAFRGRSFDESSAVRRMAAHYGTDHQELDLNPGLDLAAAVEEIPYFCDEPNGDTGALPLWFLSRLTKQTATVALSGDGANELFGGYLTYRADDLARRCRRLPDGLLRLALGAARRWPVSNEEIGFDYRLKRFLEGCRMTPAQAHVYWNGTFSEEEKSALLRQPLPGALADVLKGLAGDRQAAYLRFDQQYPLPDGILAKVDRMSMAHAVDVRPPYLDHRLVEFAASLPARLKIDGANQKVILRRLMGSKLPDAVMRRREGFDIPAHDWLRGPLRPLLEDTLADAATDRAGIFRPSAIADCVRRHVERRANLGYHLWGLMILSLWMKRWRIQAEPDSQWAANQAANTYTSI
jgi:asparagine synthase (glutamine-hydrolysing)